MIANKEKKSISRSIRLTQTVFDIVSSFDGEGFNEKFETLVMYCFKQRPYLEQEIKNLTKRYNTLRDNKTKEIEKLDELISKKEVICVTLDRIGAESKELVALLQNLRTGHL